MRTSVPGQPTGADTVDKDGRQLCGEEFCPPHEYEQIEWKLDPGDRLLLFSDGAVEILDRDSRQLGRMGRCDCCGE